MYEQIPVLYQKFGLPLLSNFRIADLGVDSPSSAGAFVLADQVGRIVLIRREPHPEHPGWERYWWIPGGGVQPFERIEDAAIREFREETGLEIELTKLLLAGIRKNKRCWFYFFFRGHVRGGCLSPKNDPDQTTAAVRCFRPSEIPALDLWSDLDKILLAQEGLLSYSVSDLLAKHGLEADYA